MVFESDRLGFSDIWSCEIDRSDCTQLSSSHGMSGTARWSPDGHYVVSESVSRGYYEVYLVEVPGVANLDLCPLSPEPITALPTGRETGSGFTFVLPTKRGRYNSGSYRLKADRQFG